MILLSKYRKYIVLFLLAFFISNRCYAIYMFNIPNKDKNYFDDDINKALITNKIDENQVKYINVRYGTCVYDITNGINQVDYYFYVIVIKTDKQNYKILITGKYPYPIALN